VQGRDPFRSCHSWFRPLRTEVLHKLNVVSHDSVVERSATLRILCFYRLPSSDKFLGKLKLPRRAGTE